MLVRILKTKETIVGIVSIIKLALNFVGKFSARRFSGPKPLEASPIRAASLVSLLRPLQCFVRNTDSIYFIVKPSREEIV